MWQVKIHRLPCECPTGNQFSDEIFIPYILNMISIKLILANLSYCAVTPPEITSTDSGRTRMWNKKLGVKKKKNHIENFL